MNDNNCNVPFEAGCEMISLMIWYELRKTRLERGICGFRTSTNVFKLRLNNWAAWFSVSMHWPLLFALTIGLHPNGFTEITTIFLAPKLYNFCHSHHHTKSTTCYRHRFNAYFSKLTQYRTRVCFNVATKGVRGLDWIRLRQF